MTRRILITGASIAGNTAAWALARLGVELTVVEQAPHFRGGGQNIDVRGVGRQVLQRMSLEQDALDQGTGEEGTAWIDAHGNAVATFKTDDLDGDGPTAELEILRGDLARLVYDAARDTVAYRFGDRIARIDDGADAATVTFQSGRCDCFDAVIVAEGVGSSTRDLLFPGENDPRWMDLTIAYFTIARTADDDRLWRWYHTTGGRSISLRPDRHGTTRAMLSLQKPPEGEQDWSVTRQQAYLRERFADAGWQATRVLEGMDTTDDFYFDVLRQVRMPRWRKGRVLLTGDAAWCVTPLGGLGATLAITGGYVLANEIARGHTLEDAAAAYEAAMRPMVDSVQGIPKLGPRLMNPHSRLGIHLLHAALKLASQPSVQNLAVPLMTPSIQEPDLSRYD